MEHIENYGTGYRLEKLVTAVHLELFFYSLYACFQRQHVSLLTLFLAHRLHSSIESRSPYDQSNTIIAGDDAPRSARTAICKLIWLCRSTVNSTLIFRANSTYTHVFT